MGGEYATEVSFKLFQLFGKGKSIFFQALVSFRYSVGKRTILIFIQVATNFPKYCLNVYLSVSSAYYSS